MIIHRFLHKLKSGNFSLKQYAFLIVTLFAMLVVFLFAIQPTDIYNMASQKKKAILILLLSINFVFIIATELIYIHVRNLSGSKRIIKAHIVFSSIIVITSLLILYIRHPYMTRHHYINFIFATIVIVAVFQLLTLFFIKKMFYNDPVNSNEKIVISDNKTSLNIDPENLILIKAEGNYVTVFEKTKDYLIRSSLKKIMQQNPQTGLIRCHKSYIVNTSKIKSISGNSKGYKISLLDYDFEIPVSVEIGKQLKKMI